VSFLGNLQKIERKKPEEKIREVQLHGPTLAQNLVYFVTYQAGYIQPLWVSFPFITQQAVLSKSQD
jgi:hypothetical protein